MNLFGWLKKGTIAALLYNNKDVAAAREESGKAITHGTDNHSLAKPHDFLIHKSAPIPPAFSVEQTSTDVKYFHELIETNNLPELKKYLQQHESDGSFDINAQDRSGRTAALIAAAEGHDEILELLIENGADIDKVNSSNETPLSRAAKNNHLTTATILLESGAKTETTETQHGWTPLLYAARNGNIDMIALLLDHGANIKAAENQQQWQCIHFAAQQDRLDILDLLVEHDNSILKEKNIYEETALYLAARDGHTHTVKTLTTKYRDLVDIDALDNTQNSPLMLAARYGYSECFKSLLAAGANTRLKEKEHEWTVGHFISKHGNLEMLKALVEKDPEAVHYVNTLGRTPLHLTAEDNNVKMLEFLISKGSDINAKDNNGVTALVLATKNNAQECFYLLLEAGADVNIKEAESGWTALHFSVAQNNLEFFKKLQKHSTDDAIVYAAYLAMARDVKEISDFIIKGIDPAKINFQDADGTTLLMAAVETGKAEYIEMLIEEGADTTIAETKHGWTATHIAAKFNSQPSLQKLIESNHESINYKDAHGKSPFMVALELHSTDTFDLFLENPETDLNQVDNNGKPLISYAIDNGHYGIAKRLVGKGVKIRSDEMADLSEIIKDNPHNEEAKDLFDFFYGKYEDPVGPTKDTGLGLAETVAILGTTAVIAAVANRLSNPQGKSNKSL